MNTRRTRLRRFSYPIPMEFLAPPAAAAGDHAIALPAMDRRARIVFVLKRLAITAAGSAVVFHLAIALFACWAGVVFSFVNPPFTSLMLERLAADRIAPRAHRFVVLDRIPDFAESMFLRLEDKNFYRHGGLDFGAIRYAYQQNRRWGRVIMGGSTITQQTVRSLLLTQKRNYLRKYVEAAASLVLDAVMGKRRILELYLNYIEWGRGVYGIGAAAEYYYRRSVDKLSYDEYARLAAIIIDPLDYGVADVFRHPAMAARYSLLTAPAEEELEEGVEEGSPPGPPPEPVLQDEMLPEDRPPADDQAPPAEGLNDILP